MSETFVLRAEAITALLNELLTDMHDAKKGVPSVSGSQSAAYMVLQTARNAAYRATALLNA